jgi:ABC-type transport system substrate-binding protein
MEMEKKNLAIIILAVVLAASGVGNIILGIGAGAVKVPVTKKVVREGWREGNQPAVLDPIDCWESAGGDVIHQVMDTLWAYEPVSGDYNLVNTLATGRDWSPDGTQLTVTLREDVLFHDGKPFNATAVKFTFDRIMYFVNYSGDLPSTTHEGDPSSLFYTSKGYPMLNKTVINDNFNITFVLNGPYAIWEPVCAYVAAAIVSPDSTPATEYLVLGTDILVGTGAFKYIHLLAGEEMKFERWEYYWGETVYWDEVIWVYYPDSVTAGNALLGGEVHKGSFPSSMVSEVIAAPDLVFVNMESSFIYRYIGFNNEFMNNSLIRKAIAYAYNYTYFVDVVMRGYAIRAHSFIPPGFPYYNASFTGPYWNTSIAREAMLVAAAADGKDVTGLTADAVGVSASNDAAWLGKNFYTFKFYIPEGSTTTTEMGIAFNNDMNKIGISVTNDVMDWETFIFTVVHNPDRLNIFYTGWGPDYMDPFNMIEPLLNNLSNANHIQLQDQQLMEWLWEYEETIPGAPADKPLLFEDRKEELVHLIQDRAFNQLYVELPCTYDMVLWGHHVSLGNVAYNLRGDLWHQYSYFLPGVPTI